METGRIGFYLSADDTLLMAQMHVSGKRAGELLGRLIHQNVARETDRGLRNWRISDAIGIGVGQGIGQKIVDGILGVIRSGLTTAGGLISESIQVGGDFEKTQVAFTTFLGNAQKARQVLADIQKFSAETPFELPEVTKSARSLLAYGIEAKDLIKTLREVGDVAAGVSAPIEDIAEIYGKARTAGRLYAEDINQLTGRGIPIIDQLAKQFGVAESQVKKLVEEGSIGFPELQKAFEAMTAAGGKFENLMAKQSQTVLGKISTLNDQFTLLKIKVFEAFKPATNEVVDVLGQVFSGLQDNDEALSRLRGQAETFGAELKQHPENVEAIKKAINDLAAEGFDLVADAARELTSYLRENPTAIREGVQALREFLSVLQAVVGLLGTALKGWQQISDEIEGGEKAVARQMLNSSQQKEVERRMAQKEKRGEIIHGTPIGFGAEKRTYKNVYQQVAQDVLTEDAIKRQREAKFKLKPGEVYGPVDTRANLPAPPPAPVKPPESKQDKALRDRQNAEIRKARAEYQQAVIKAKQERYSPNSIERIDLEEQLEVQQIRVKHSEKITQLRQQLNQYIKDRQQKIKKGEKGGVDLTAAITRTQTLITQQQKILNVELGESRDKYQKAKLENRRETERATKTDRERLREAQISTETRRLAASEMSAPGSLQQQEIRYRIEVANVNERYDQQRREQEAKLTEFRQKQSDKIKSGQTSGFDYTAAIKRQQELMRLTELSRQTELRGLGNRRNWEVRQQTEEATEQRRKSVRSIGTEMQSSRQTLKQAQGQYQESTASDSDTRRKIQQQNERSNVNNRFDNQAREIKQQIEDLEQQRKRKIQYGLNDGVDYSAEIKAKQQLLADNEAIRKTELEILSIKQKQEDVVAKRESSDRLVERARNRRDVEIQGKTDSRVTQLQSRKVGLSDPIAIAAIDKEIAEVRLGADRDAEINRLNDRLKDLRTQQARLKENRRLGISDPSLEAIDYAKEISSVQQQIKAVSDRFNSESRTLQGNFESSINEQFKQERQRLREEAQSLRLETLRTQIADTKDERVKLKLQLEIDRTQIEHQYTQAIETIDKWLQDLTKRRGEMVKQKLSTGEIDNLINSVTTLRRDTEQQQQRAINVLNQEIPGRVAMAEAQQSRQSVNRVALTGTPRVELSKALAQQAMERGDLTKAAAYGREAAIGEESLRYNEQRASIAEQVAQAKLNGIEIPTEELQRMNDAIEQIHQINIQNITAQFDDLARAISTSNQELLDLTQGAAQDFFAQWISGSKSMNDAWNGLVKSVLNGISQIVAQKISSALFGGSAPGQKNDSFLSTAISTVGKILGFADGGVVPEDSRFGGFRQGNNPIAEALRKEGPNAVIVATTPGERILNLQETAAYHSLFPSGILNYNQGGIAGELPSFKSPIAAGSATMSSGKLGGKFEFDFKHQGDTGVPQFGLDQVNSMVEAKVRDVMINEMRPGGIFNRYRS